MAAAMIHEDRSDLVSFLTELETSYARYYTYTGPSKEEDRVFHATIFDFLREHTAEVTRIFSGEKLSAVLHDLPITESRVGLLSGTLSACLDNEDDIRWRAAFARDPAAVDDMTGRINPHMRLAGIRTPLTAAIQALAAARDYYIKVIAVRSVPHSEA